MCPVVGGVADVSTTMDLGQSGDVTVSSRGLPRPIPVSDSVYDIWWFYDIKTYMYIYFKRVYVLWKRTLVVFDVTLAWRLQRKFRPARVVLKKSYYPQIKLIYIILIILYVVL